MTEERLQKYIASCGVTSRRKAEELIMNGRVIVNGYIVSELGTKIDSSKDIVFVDGKRISCNQAYIYIKLFKPEGYVTTVKDQFGRKCVMDLIGVSERIYPIGRLDYDTSGILLLTNDGDLANKLMHPKYHVDKMYIANVDGQISQENIHQLEKGVKIEDYTTAPAKVDLIETFNTSSTVSIIIHEGKNRQVKKMCEAIGHKVNKLKRISFGEITLDEMESGQWCYLTDREINFLKKQEV